VPASVRFVLGVLLLAAIATLIAISLTYGEDEHQARITAEQITGGSVAAGRATIDRYRCGGCHMIRGVSAANGQVGPSLNGIAVRSTIAGKLANTPDNMVVWLQHPQAVVPGNGMPEQGVTATEARDMAAYLYTLRR
jgi:cytochrome c